MAAGARCLQRAVPVGGGTWKDTSLVGLVYSLFRVRNARRSVGGQPAYGLGRNAPLSSRK